MDRNYWEKIAPSYNAEIFDVLHNDKSGLIVAAIKKYASKKKTVIDIGCAIGKWIPLLATNFKHVIAADISAINLEIAKERCRQFENVEYLRTDMSSKYADFTPCDFAICINAILTDSHTNRMLFFKSLSHSVKKGGAIVIVVPSIESALYASFMADQIALKKKKYIPRERPSDAVKKYNQLKRGIVDIDNVPTKHHQREEMIVLLKQQGFVTEDVQKIEYTWKTEFDNPPSWMKDPYPWDWMFVARKK